MSALADHHRAAGASVAPDGIPQAYAGLAAEYAAAQQAAVLLDRSHEGRVRLHGADALALIQRTSTNDVLALRQGGQGCATVFISPIGRVLDRVEVWRMVDDSVLLLTAPARGAAVRAYVQQNIFFRDKVTVADVTADSAQLALHGPQAAAVADALSAGASALPVFGHQPAQVGDLRFDIGRAKPLHGDHFRIVCAAADAPAVWQAVLHAGQPFGLMPAGSALYNVLRIESGTPGVGRELTEEYIPLELGLWDEVSFAKGCYTGQEIIARMESRGKLAKTLVRLTLDAPVDVPADLLVDGKRAGVLTSSVSTPDGRHVGIGLLKPDYAEAGTRLQVGMVGGVVR
jgi:aminomethyltransferase